MNGTPLLQNGAVKSGLRWPIGYLVGKIQKRILKQKFLDQNVHYANGSKFKINREFITFINLLLQKGQTKDVTIIDDNDNPAQILDFAKFVDDVMNIYAKNVNHYYTQLHKIKKRDIKDVLGRWLKV